LRACQKAFVSERRFVRTVRAGSAPNSPAAKERPQTQLGDFVDRDAGEPLDRPLDGTWPPYTGEAESFDDSENELEYVQIAGRGSCFATYC
jgi:hypothetical protein